MSKVKFSLPIIILLAILAGFLFEVPAMAKDTLPYLLAIILFYGFLKAEMKLAKFWHPVLLFPAIANFIISPLLVIFLGQVLNLPLGYVMGLLLIVFCPPAVSSSLIVEHLNGNCELALANTIFYYIFSFISYPLALKIYAGTSQIQMDLISLSQFLLMMICLPLLCATLVRKLQARKIKSWLKFEPAVSRWCIFLIIWISISLNVRKIAWDYSLYLVIFMIMIIIAVNYLMAQIATRRLSACLKKTLPIMLIYKNSALAVTLASLYFEPRAGIPVILYTIAHNFFNAAVCYYCRDK